jgi:hypothetical protein
MARHFWTAILAAAFAVGVAAGSTPAGPRSFVPRVTNPWFPLTPGTTYVYRGLKDGKIARDVVNVLHTTKTIRGVRCTSVSDRLYLAGRLEERTTDWYAQDRRGNVWYFGEATAELDRAGHVTSTEGTWLAGRHGARAGIFFPAHPRVGQTGRQEYFKGHAEDHFAVVSVSAHVSVPYVTSSHAVLTKEWTPLEPGTIDHKYYLRGIGNVKEVAVKGSAERNVLVSVRRSVAP